jgi:regulator of RNase E activity RraA
MANKLDLLDPSVIKAETIRRPDSELVRGYQALGVADVAGRVARAMDPLGINCTIPASRLQPIQMGKVLVGPAMTVRNIPEREMPLRRWRDGEPTRLGEREAFFLLQQGDVVVIDGSAVHPASCLGSMAVATASYLGAAGIIVSGAVTGVAGIREAKIPVWARSGTTITGHHRAETVEINGPMGIEGVRVEPGDLIVADDSGVTVVPFDLAEDVLERARASEQKGSGVRALLDSNADRDVVRSELASFMRDLTAKPGAQSNQSG